MSLTASRLRELMEYDPKTGLWIRLYVINGRQRPTSGNPTHSEGYCRITIKGERKFTHQWAFLYMTGSIPDEIDHINGDRSDNRWGNLRAATRTQNNGNRRVSKRHLPKGVTEVMSRGKKTGRFFARIHHQGQRRHLGCFASVEEAQTAYMNAAIAAFGQFASAG